MTYGDSIQVKCPACGKNIPYPLGTDGTPQHGKIKETTKACPHCNQSLYLWARWKVAVEAELEGKVP